MYKLEMWAERVVPLGPMTEQEWRVSAFYAHHNAFPFAEVHTVITGSQLRIYSFMRGVYVALAFGHASAPTSVAPVVDHKA